MSLGFWVSLCFPTSFGFVKNFAARQWQLCLVTSGFIRGSARVLAEMETHVPLLATRLLKQWFPRKWSFLRSLKLENEKGRRLEELVSLNESSDSSEDLSEASAEGTGAETMLLRRITP